MNDKKTLAIPLVLAAMIGIFILFLAWSGKQASTGGTDVTDSDYYSKGLKYNSTLVEKRAASVIGWTLQSHLDGNILRFTLKDKHGKPIADANGQLILDSTKQSRSSTLVIAEPQPGHYRIELPEEMSGEQLVRVDFERGGARINRRLLLNISGK